MKKLVLLSVGVLFLSCSSPEDATTSNKNCNCGEVTKSATFHTINQSGTYTYSVFTVKNYCTGATKQVTREGVYKVGSQSCN